MNVFVKWRFQQSLQFFNEVHISGVSLVTIAQKDMGRMWSGHVSSLEAERLKMIPP